MTPLRNVADVIGRVADGEAIDWDEVQTGEGPGFDPSTLQALRILNDIARAHRESADSMGLEPVAHPAGPPTRWGKYLLTDKLGSGGFGEVFCAWDASLQRDVAIKLLRPNPGADLIRQRLLDEGRRLAEVRHTNVVWVLEAEEHGGRFGLAMEFIRGRTLHEVVRLEGTLGAPEALNIGISLSAALEAVHAKNLVHRDVKPNNVMRDEAGRIVLMDFGSGIRVLDGGTRHPTSVGTPLYMAPELLAGGSPSPASDIYSLGVLLYFLVSGRHPVEGATVDEIRRQHASGGSRPVTEVAPNLPAGFVEVLNRTLSPDPGRRIQTAVALRRALDDVHEALIWKQSRTQSILASAGAAAGVLALMLVAGYVTTATYEFLLGITPQFTTERVLDVLVWGSRSLVAPVALAAFVSGLTYLALECWGLTLKVSAACRQVRQRILRMTGRVSVARQIGLRDWATIAVLASVGFVIMIPFVVFPAYVRALVSEPLTTAPAESLSLLGAPGAAVQDAYRITLAAAITVSSGVWVVLWRSARRAGVTLGAAGWLGLGCLLTMFVLLSVPYRIIYHSDGLEKAVYAGSPCSITGTSADMFLLFCPDRTPRTFTINGADPAFARTGTRGQLFESVH